MLGAIIGSCPTTDRQQQVRMQRTALFALVIVCGATLSAAIGNDRDANRNSGVTLDLVVYYATSAKNVLPLLRLLLQFSCPP